MLVLDSKSKLNKIDYNHTVNLGTIPLKFTDKYRYLGVSLDTEMNLTGLLSDTKKRVLNKLFNLRKLRHYITDKSALAIYKQTILPILDYAGFMFISCTKSDRNDLQILQNDALRTCYNVRRRDKLSISNMHTRANLLSLEQRRTFQLLSLMYIHKNNPVNLRPIVRNTRAADRDQFYIERFTNCKYKNSPFYKGAEMWSLLPHDIIESDTLYQFKQSMKKKYCKYSNSLS